jgi:hypothetical protein
MLRENYETTYTPDPEVVAGIVEAVSRLVEDQELRRQLGRAAREAVAERYTPEAWNRGLKASLDLARGASEPQVFQARVPVPATRGAREEVATKV